MAREMKDTGLQWLGKIPKNWNLVRIGTQYTERRTKVSDTEYPPLSVTMKGILPQLSTAAKTDAHDDRKLVCVGDFAINSRSDRRGSCGISPYDGSVSLINTILTPREKMNPRYYDWLFHSTMFSDEYYSWGHGIVDDLWTTGWQDMKKIMIPEPPLEEQAKIAAYLDSKCAEIDSVIANTQRTIEEYKKLKQAIITEAVTKGVRGKRTMKDSGIEWIGEIPVEWEVTKFKKLGYCRNGLTYSPENQCGEEGTLVLRSSNIQNGMLDFSDCVYVNCSVRDDLMVRPNDILICSRNGSAKLIGKNAIIPDGLKASFGAFMMIYRCQSPKYIQYVLSSHIFSYYLGTFLTVSVNQLTGKNFDNIQFPYTDDYLEQEEIITYLDKKCSEIDRLIESKQQLLIELESYKKSVIYEYVTGKKEVPVCQ